MIQRARTILRDLGRDSGGNVLPLAATGILVMAALVGGGVDMSRAYKAQNRLQSACDAAVLAGRKAVAEDGFDDVAEGEANAYFAANFDEAAQEVFDTAFEATSDDDGASVDGVASGEVRSIVMSIFGVDRIAIAANCSAAMGMGNADIMMVLDTTGSMEWNADGDDPSAGETSRIEDLRVAMKNFYDTVAESASGSNTRIRYGFVPYSSSVNVGQILLDTDEDYLVDTMTIQSRAWVKWGTATSNGAVTTYANEDQGSWSRGTQNYSTESLCIAALPAATAWVNDGSSSSYSSTSSVINDSGQKVTISYNRKQPERRTAYSCRYRSSDRKWYRNSRTETRDKLTGTQTTQDPTFITSASDPFDGLVYFQRTYDVSAYKQFSEVSLLIGNAREINSRNATAPVALNTTWKGCIEERATVAEESFTWTAADGITPSDALDLDIDTAPGSDDDTKWRPLWPEAGYYRSSGTIYAESGTKPSVACPVAAQLLAEMDEDAFYAYADDLETGGNTYHDIGLLWGARFSSPDGPWASNVGVDPANGGSVSRHLIFMTDGELNTTTTTYSSYGIERHDRRVTSDGSTNQDANHRSRFLAICEAIKGKGIRLWVIAFGTGLSTDLETCASAGSSFAASSATELNSAFQSIATEVGELRVVQ